MPRPRGSITGTGAVTMAAMQVQGTGPVTGSGAVAMAAMRVQGTGAETGSNITGSGAVAMAAMRVAGTGPSAARAGQTVFVAGGALWMAGFEHAIAGGQGQPDHRPVPVPELRAGRVGLAGPQGRVGGIQQPDITPRHAFMGADFVPFNSALACSSTPRQRLRGT